MNFSQQTESLENTTAVLAKEMFGDLKALKTRISVHGEDLDILDQNIQIIPKAMNDKIQKRK